MKSTSCKGSNNQYLEEYHSEAAALFDAERIKKEFGHDLQPYVCRACGYWHLTSESKTRQCMFCTDSALFLKDIYTTRQEAEAVATRVGKQSKIRLFPYKCPYSSGWHLTKTKGK
jgi:hypothetical protein